MWHPSPLLSSAAALTERGGGGGVKTGENTASRQQDAHGPEKDGCSDPGNGERRRGRRDFFGSQLCEKWKKEKSTGCHFVVLCVRNRKRRRNTVCRQQRGLSAVVVVTAVQSASPPSAVLVLLSSRYLNHTRDSDRTRHYLPDWTLIWLSFSFSVTVSTRASCCQNPFNIALLWAFKHMTSLVKQCLCDNFVMHKHTKLSHNFYFMKNNKSKIYETYIDN